MGFITAIKALGHTPDDTPVLLPAAGVDAVVFGPGIGVELVEAPITDAAGASVPRYYHVTTDAIVGGTIQGGSGTMPGVGLIQLGDGGDVEVIAGSAGGDLLVMTWAPGPGAGTPEIVIGDQSGIATLKLDVSSIGTIKLRVGSNAVLSVSSTGVAIAGRLAITPTTPPASPASGVILCVDSTDGNKLKAFHSNGTINTLSTP